MPQMAPMYWLILLLIFTLCFIMIIVINYFSLTKNNPNSKMIDTFKTPFKFNWKW